MCVCVCRLLAAALGEGDAPKYLPQDVEDFANHCNKKRKNAKTAEVRAPHIVTYSFHLPLSLSLSLS